MRLPKPQLRLDAGSVSEDRLIAVIVWTFAILVLLDALIAVIVWLAGCAWLVWYWLHRAN